MTEVEVNGNPQANLEEQAAVQRAAEYYASAVKLAPSSAVARNMESMARIYLGNRGDWAEESPADVATSLQKALALETSNRDITANLEALYGLMSHLPEKVTRIDEKQLERKMSAMRQVRAYQAKQ
ncbi:MAG: hypothetical protein GY906_39435 [bacterium]|nr:hypothetical protein [bacterium]